MKDVILTIVKEKREQMISAVSKGIEDENLEDFDYLSAYKEIENQGYSRYQIIESLFKILSIESINVKELNVIQLNECKILLSALYEILEEDYHLVEKILKIFIEAVIKNPSHFIKESESLMIESSKYNSDIANDSSSLCLDAKTKTQELTISSKIYLDICEGLYSNALLLLVFHIDVLTNKNRTVKQIKGFSYNDKLNIIKSYDPELYVDLIKGYESIIRNGSAHKSYSIKEWPTLIFTNTDKKGNTESIEIEHDKLTCKSNQLFSVASAIYTADTLKGIDENFFEVVRNVDTRSILKRINKKELERKHSR